MLSIALESSLLYTRRGLFVSSGGWGEGKMKALGKRWEGKKSERESYPPNATYLQSSSEIRRHRDRIIW